MIRIYTLGTAAIEIARLQSALPEVGLAPRGEVIGSSPADLPRSSEIRDQGTSSAGEQFSTAPIQWPDGPSISRVVQPTTHDRVVANPSRRGRKPRPSGPGMVQRITPSAGRRFGLLLYMAMGAGRQINRASLQEMFFPRQSDDNGRHSLRELVHQVRKLGATLAGDSSYLALLDSVHQDCHALSEAVDPSDAHLSAASGGFLPGYAPTFSAAYSQWLEELRARETLALCRAVLRHTVLAKSRGDWQSTERMARVCLALDPLNEEATCVLAEMLARSGAKSRAVAVLENYVREVGVTNADLRVSASILRRRIGETAWHHQREDTALVFEGRDNEMKALRAAFEASRRGESQCVLVVGPPGIGKSRVLAEFSSIIVFEGSRIGHAVAQPVDAARPMGMVADLVPTLTALPGALGAMPLSLDALGRLTNGEPNSASTNSAAGYTLVSRDIARALQDLVEAITAETHLTLIIDDAHWADSASLQTLSWLASRNRNLCVLFATRDAEAVEREARLPERVTSLELSPLGQEAAHRLSAEALKGTGAERDTTFRTWMVNVSDGNPLYLSTIITHYITTGERLQVPPSLAELLARRVRTLDMTARAVLETCALLGSFCTIPRLTACLDLPVHECANALEQLTRCRMLAIEDGDAVRLHPIVVDVIVDRSSRAAVQLIRRRVAAVLEAEVESTAAPALLWHSAKTWADAGDDARAAEVWQRCAGHAIAIGRPGYAAEAIYRAATAVREPASRVDLLAEAIELGASAAQHRLVVNAAARLRETGRERAHDDIELAELSSLSVTCGADSDYEHRITDCVTCEGASAEHRVHAALAGLKYADGACQGDFARQLVQVIQPGRFASGNRLLDLEYLLLSDATIGQLDRVPDHVSELRRLFGTATPEHQSRLMVNCLVASLRAGRICEAIDLAEQCYHFAEPLGLDRVRVSAAMQIANVLTATNDLGGFERWWSRLEELLGTNPESVDDFEAACLRADIALFRGDAAGAITVLEIAERRGAFVTPARSRWLRCLSLRSRQLVGERIPLADVDDLVRDTGTAFPTTELRDIEAAVAFTALRQAGQSSAASEFIQRFKSLRAQYTRAPLARLLQSALM